MPPPPPPDAVFLTKVESCGFYRVKPRTPLAPGEYGFVATRGGSPMGSSIYDFGVD